MIDLLYVSFNRLAYTRESWAALEQNTDWARVRHVHVVDDGSTDGTLEHLEQRLDAWRQGIGRVYGTDLTIHAGPHGGPVDAMNLYLEQPDAVEVFAKVDNDFVVCPGWLGELERVLAAHPELDILGTEPFVGGPSAIPDQARTVTACPHIGGKGLLRRRAFEGRPMWADGRQGFTQWQTRNEQVAKAWVTPDLPCFGLDQLPFEPWLSLATRYTQLGWHRAWPPYSADATGYWQWWQPAFELELP